MFDSHQGNDLCPLDFVDDILEFGVVGGSVCKRWTHGAQVNVSRVFRAKGDFVELRYNFYS